jgi:hypothetical protein
MEKYEKHGLTLKQDNILGAFGEPETLEELDPYSYPAEWKSVFKELIRKGLLESHIRNDDTVVYRLTPKGKALWKIRATEEEEGPSIRR